MGVAPVCKVKVEAVENGLIPSGKVVTIKTVTGVLEEVAVSGTLVDRPNRILLASRFHLDDKIALIESPREAVSGRWRVMVERGALVERVAPWF